MNEVKDKLNVPIKWLFIFFVLINFTSCSNKKKIEIKNNSGVVIERYFISKDDQAKTGAYSKFYDNGKILETGIYKDGKLNGERKLYYESGKVMQSETYADDKFDGPYKSYYDDGSIQQEGTYKDNMMSGLWKNYYKDPKNVLKNQLTMEENKIKGPSKEYYTNGKINAEGNKVEIGDGIDVYDGKVQVYDSTGTLEKIITYDKGRQIAKDEKK
ncbi:MAG: hypothetical protein JWN78_2661 [Bacteroidota bacterium]|nr:hypothetical protein [Bacteroidota bacterium]